MVRLSAWSQLNDFKVRGCPVIDYAGSVSKFTRYLNKMAFKDVHRQPVLLLRLISFNRTLLGGLLGRPSVRGLGLLA